MNPVLVAFILIAVCAGLALLLRSWALWRSATLLSLRLEGLREVFGAGFWIAVLLAAFLVPTRSLKPTLVFVLVLGAATALTTVQLAVLWTRRRERRMEEQALQDEGLPIRERILSWRVVGLLCLLCGPIIAAALTTAILMSLVIFGSRGAGEGSTVVISGTTMLVWLVGSGYLTLRQWRREHRIDRRYWNEYRAALDEDVPGSA